MLVTSLERRRNSKEPFEKGALIFALYNGVVPNAISQLNVVKITLNMVLVLLPLRVSLMPFKTLCDLMTS